MPQIKPSHLLLSLVMTLALAGCGDKNSQAVFSQENGHPDGWLAAHKTSAQASTDSCMECHGADLKGAITQVACTSCHVGGAPVGVNGFGKCTSCHGNPPDGPATGYFPNRGLSHDVHAALSNVINVPGGVCNTCHNGYGYNTPDHGTLTSARMSLYTSFRAKQAISAPVYSRNASGDVTCANVSCHGGKTTPVWGSTVVCTSCHEQGTARAVPEYNSFYSGYSVSGLTDPLGITLGATLGTNQHARHLSRTVAGTAVTCTDCHDVWKLTNAQHFGGIVSKTFVSPGSTIIGATSAKIGSYNSATQTCNNISCHTFAPSTNAPWYNF